MIASFLSSCRQPAVLEYGEDPISLKAGEYSFEIRAGRLVFEAWGDSRCVSRRIISVECMTTGLLDASVQRFGGKQGKITFLDLERPQSAHRASLGTKQTFAEKFRRMLSRQFPGWEISSLSTSLDLRRSFSSSFPRARLSRGNQTIAAVACPSREQESTLLTYALLWYEYVRGRAEANTRLSAALFLPEGTGALTANRLRWLTGAGSSFTLFLFNEHGAAGEVDPQDLGNLETRVSSRYLAHPAVACQTGDVSGPPRSFADRFSPVPTFPEQWFETVVRSNLNAIDPDLIPNPVHSQVLSFAAQDRDLIDLVGITQSGRLVVLELKASEDIHLPLQSLDYWMRIRWHAERNELQHLFPRVHLNGRAPKLLLVAPAMSFHPACVSILRYFSPEIEVERVGVNTEWQKRFQIVLRLQGADVPVSHRSSESCLKV